MQLASTARDRATCPRLKVGAVLVKDNRVISTGYNGSLPGEVHCEDVGCLLVDGRCKRTIHAEVNAISQVKWLKRSGSTLYTTHAPCSACMRTIIHSGIIHVIYAEMYKNSQPQLKPYIDNGIVLEQFIPG
jgi:dCMP deaminase